MGKTSGGIEENGRVIVITSLVMLVITALISTVVFFYSVKSADKVLTPNVKGKKLEEALLEMQAKELYPRLQLRFSDNPEDEGRVLEQNPAAGAVVKAGRRINLVVSRGAVIDRVEDYVGRNISEVQHRLASLFTAGHKRLITVKEPPMYKHSSVPEGTILEQNPNPGKEISSSIEMEFVISKGPENEKISIPNFISMNMKDLYIAMGKNKIEFSFKSETDKLISEPKVSLQSIEQGNSVSAYSKMNLTIKVPESEDFVFGIYNAELPKYPYPLKVAVDAVYPDGKRKQLVDFKHSGGKCEIPYYLPEHTVIALTVLNKEVKTFEVVK